MNDLQFLKKIHTYTDKEISQVNLHSPYTFVTIQSQSTKNSACMVYNMLNNPMNLQRGFLPYNVMIHL